MINLSQSTEALARRVAEAQSVSVEDAIRKALEYSARAAGILVDPPREKDCSPEAVNRRKAQIDEIVDGIAALPILDPRSPREIMDDLNEL